jgi:ABC-type branched-subunit amino acid transport system substrate-binding protein
MKKVTFIRLITLLVGILFFGSNSSAAEIKTINIGATQVLSGFGAALGLTLKKFDELLVDDFNKSGGIVIQGQRYNFKLIFEDDKYTAEGGRAAIDKLVNTDKVSAIITTSSAAAVMAGLDITEPSKVPYFCCSAEPRLTDPKYHYVVSFITLRTIFAVQWGWMAKNRPDIKNVLLIATDDITGHNDVINHTKAMKAFGINVIDAIYFPRNATDLSPVATKAKQLNPGAISFVGVFQGGPQAAVLKALYQAGWKGITNNAVGISFKENLGIAGKDALERWVGPIMDGSGMTPPPAPYVKLKNLYETKYGLGSWEKDNVAIYNPFNASWYFLPKAIKKANSLNPDAIMKAVEGMAADTPTGVVKLIVPVERTDNPRAVEPIGEVTMGEIKGGKMNVLGRASIDDAIKYAQTVYQQK